MKTVLNGAIGNLQQHRITNHSTLLCERVVNDVDMSLNYEKLIDEFLKYTDKAISAKIDRTIKQMRDEGRLGEGINFTVSTEDLESILNNASDRINLSVDELCEKFNLDRSLVEIINSYSEQYSDGSVDVSLRGDEINYKSKYKYVTDSIATDDSYVYTDYTCDNGNVVMVTYEREVNGEVDTVVFLLNYNVFSVKIRVDETVHEAYADYCDEDGYIILDSYGFVKIEG